MTAAERLAARLSQALHLLSVTEEALEKAQARVAEMEAEKTKRQKKGRPPLA